tara:strand:+ start:143 stop:1339 length:1197 start_codon:yes stop_codon:yes gene_type:complete
MTLLVMVIGMLSSFFVTIILGQTLTFSDFGEFVLLKQIILIGSSIAIFGLDFSYIKVFSNNSDAGKKIHLITIIILSLISISFVLMLYIFYGFQLYKSLFIFWCICFGAINLYQAAIYRLKDQFLIAQLFSEGWKVALLLLIGVVLFSGMTIDLQLVYQIFTVSLLFSSSFIIKYFFKTHNVNDRDTNYRNYLTLGLVFWLINSTGLISGGIDKLVVPIIYDSEVLGIFTGVSFIFVISLTMIGSAIGYVIFPKISAGNEINITKLSFAIFFITLFAIIIFHITGMELVSIIFKGKFDNYIDNKIIFCFTLLGSFQIVHIILHFILSAKGNKKQLIYYWILSIFFIGMFISLLYVLKTYFPFSLLSLSIIILITRFTKIIFMIFLLKRINVDEKYSII